MTYFDEIQLRRRREGLEGTLSQREERSPSRKTTGEEIFPRWARCRKPKIDSGWKELGKVTISEDRGK